MEQVLDVYKRPYDPNHPVVCLDETAKQLVSEIRQPILTPDGVTLYDYEYKREGACDIYMVSEPLAGKRSVSVQDCHNRLVWATIVADVVENQYPHAEKITLVQDNLSAHKPYAMYELFEPERAKTILGKIEFVYTPKHTCRARYRRSAFGTVQRRDGSWLNMAEIELSILSRQCTNQRFASKEILIAETALWVTQRNALEATIDWQFTTADARIKLKRLYPSIIT